MFVGMLTGASSAVKPLGSSSFTSGGFSSCFLSSGWMNTMVVSSDFSESLLPADNVA
jgi:hypothetical protein